LNKRYLGALVISPFIIFIFLGGEYLFVLTALVSLVGMYEFYKVIKIKNMHPISILGYGSAIIYYLIIHRSQSLDNTSVLNVLLLFMLLCIPVIKPKYNIVDVSVTYVGYMYTCVFLSFLPLINAKLFGAYLVWIPFIASWSCDILAYYSGRYLGKQGKHKLCPKVSPNKTVEGAIGGLVGSSIVCGIYGIIISSNVTIMSISSYFIIGILCGVFCQFGDLVASSIKRYIGVKDYSNLIPGHGGILDRFDSILFASVVVYYYITLVIGI
jgi:phosphatidate cytidylyltransferase